MHCTISGMFVHGQLTEAQGGTFVSAAFGMDRAAARTRLIRSHRRTAGSLRRWLAI
jgi:hypothetical protein